METLRNLGRSVCNLSGYVFHLAFPQTGMLLWSWIGSRWSCQLWKPSISLPEHGAGWREPLSYNLKLQRKRIWLVPLLTSANPYSFNCVQIRRLGTHSNGWCGQKKESHFALNKRHQYCFSTSQVCFFCFCFLFNHSSIYMIKTPHLAVDFILIYVLCSIPSTSSSLSMKEKIYIQDCAWP